MKSTIGCLTMLGLCAVVSGCGGSSANTKPWITTWVASLTEVEKCTSGTHTTQLDGSFPIVQGVEADEIVTMSTNGCNLTWVVSGSKASLQPNQMCSVPGSVGGTWMPTFTSGTLTLSAGLINVGDEGTATLVDVTGNESCTFTQSGSFTEAGG